MGLLQPRSYARPIYRKRSTNSGSVSHLRNVSIGWTSQRKRRCAPLSIVRSFSFSLSYGERRKSTKPCIPITFIALSGSRARRPLPMSKERPVALRSQRLIVRASPRARCRAAHGTPRHFCANPSPGISADDPHPDGVHAIDACLALDGACNNSTHLLSHANTHPAIFHWLWLRFCPDERFVHAGLQHPPQGWNPAGASCGETYVNVFDMSPLDPLTIPPCGPAPSEALFKTTSPS